MRAKSSTTMKQVPGTIRSKDAKAVIARKATPRRTQAERTEQMRLRLLNAAVELLSKKGYSEFRTGGVARMAGVSRGALTHHFTSKDQLVVAVVEHVYRKVTERG